LHPFVPKPWLKNGKRSKYSTIGCVISITHQSNNFLIPF
jgi:hypothetical protein